MLLYFPNKKSIRSSVRTQSKPHFRPRLDVLEGRLLPTIYMVNTVADAGGGSLRQAILDANAHPGSNTIAFNIGGGGQKSIALTESLPNITSPVILDATTQPGFSGVPLIELNGAAAGTDAIGLAVYGGNTTIKGFVINNFANIGILLRSEGANIIQGNYIGTDFSGTNARPDGYGIDVITSTDNLVGGTGTGEGNLISGNLGTGLSLFISANRNRVEGNLIGTDISGTSALPNDYGVGIFGVSSGNTIGGTVPGARNVISGNGITSGDGISIFGGSTGNVVQGNYIGTDITGQFPLGNAGSGIGISSPANLVGGLGDGTYNVISANGNYGVALLAGATDNRIQHNIIGTDLSGTTALGNASSGVGISGGASANTIGGTTWGLGNAISGNNNYGVVLFGDGTTNNAVLGNFIGASSTDTVALGNVGFGVGLANGASGNSIGAAVPGGRNIISGNTRGGISMFGAGTTGNSVQGNIIGLDYSGSAALPNLVGVSIFGNAAANTIGGAAPGAGNIISGNNGDGIQLSGASTQNNSILGNLIGTDAGGAAALPNRDAGLALFQSAADNLIGGPGPGEGNVISGNGGAGIYLSENASDNRIQGNRIGTDVTGSSPVANSNGVVLGRGTVQNLIGGSNSGEGNLISGNRLYGIYQYSVAPNQVLGNRIGTDLSGSNALPNFGGIGLLGANSDTIGGTAPGSGNLISGNTRDGIYILNGTNHVIQGNWIGTNASANSAIPNGGQGIDVTGAPTRDITIGGSQPGAANIIDYNGYDGVLVDRALNVAIVGNSISQSGNLGIELLSNGNHNQEFPTLTSVNVDGASVTIEGTLISASNTTFSVEFFGNNACNPSGYGEGEILLGTAPITTGDDGSAAFSVTFNGIDDPRQFLSATATDPENNTSRFSACLEVPGSGPGAHGPWIVDRALWSFDRAPWTIDRKAFPDSPDAPRAALHASNDQGPVTNDDYFTHTLPRNGVAPPLRDPILSPISRRAVIDFLFSDGLLDQAAPP